jgi:outer membrane protein assembly factor BamB/tetratricopeptide (TPR) repeat protein
MVRALEKEPAVFEGAPVVHDGFVYIAATRFEGDRNITAIQCYPADPEDSKPQLRWRQDVCETRELRSADERHRHHLLTLAGSLLVYCSHSGALVALDAASGRRVWGVRYPRREPTGTEVEPLRDLAPCLFADGRLYVAPADSDSLLCLDPATGQTLWERQRREAGESPQRREAGESPLHLLGVGHGKLIFTTPKGLHAVGAANGDTKEGWKVPDDGGRRRTMGRGLLLGDLVLWPTALEDDRQSYGVFAVRQEDGGQPDNPTLLHRIPSGNLLYANGCLVVTDHETVSVFVPPGRRLEERQAQVRAAPKSARARIDLARSEADAGLTDRALVSFLEAEHLADQEKPHLRDQARGERQVLLLETASRAAVEKRWSATETALRDAVALAPSPRARLDALIQAALIWQDAGQPARALPAWQAILNTAELRSLQVHDPTRTPQPAGSAATQAIGALIEQYGRSLYEPFDKEARSLWDAAAAGERPPVAERLAREYPNATITRTALAEAARLYLQAKRPGAAVQAYRSLLTLGVSGPEQAAALLGLARSFERQDCWEAARATWQRLANDHPTALLSDLAPNRTVREAVSEHLRGPPFTTAPGIASLTLPLAKGPPITLASGEFSLPVETCQAPPAAEVLFTGSVPSPLALFPLRGELICRTAVAGNVRWRQALPFAPSWAGCFRDRVVVAGERGVACVRREDGERVWDFPAPVQGYYPSSRSAPVVVRDPLAPDPLTGFRLVGGRLFFFQADRLFALDADNGKALWHRLVPSPSGRFSSRYHVMDGTVLVQTASARRWTLDAATGRLLHDAPTVRTPWPRPPLPVDEPTVCVVVDSQHLVLLDLATGQERWTYTLPGVTTRSGEPALVVGDGHALLLVTPRNIGYELQRLDPATGKPSWPRSILLRLDRLEPAAWAVDAEAVYCVERTAVYARSLEDGRVLWERPLEGPATARSLQRAGNYLLVYPAQTLKVRFQFHWLGRSLEWEGGPTLNEAGAFDVFCYDARTGRVVQRCRVEAEWPRLRTRMGPSDATRLLPQLRLGREPRTDSWPNVEVLHGSLRVAVGGQVWTLATESKREKPLPR